MSEQGLGGEFRFAGRVVGRVGFGAMKLSGPHAWGPPASEEEAVAILRAAVAGGVNHIDTSDFYGPYVTNRLIREALAPYPEDLLLVTKVGFVRGPAGEWNQAFTPELIAAAIESNLRNLGLERLEVVNLRWGLAKGPSRRPLGDALKVLVGLKEQGLIGHIGISNVTAKQFEEASGLCEVACVQNEYNLAHRVDDGFVDELAAKGVPYVPYFPLGGYTPLQSAALEAVAEALDATPMQVALAWLLQRSPNMLLIPGTSSLAHLQENLRAGELELSPLMLANLDAIGG